MRRRNIKDAKVAHVHAASSTDKKIKGLTVQVRHYALSFSLKYCQYFYTILIFFQYFKIREHFYNELKTALLENYQHLHTEINKQFDEKNMHNVANNIEYKIFSNSKVPNKYKFDISKLVCNIFCKYIFMHFLNIFYNHLLSMSNIRKEFK